MKRGNGPILVFFSDYSFFKDQSWGLQLAARRSWQLHLFRLGHRLPSNSLLFVPGKCDSTQRFQAENSVCLFFKDFYWFLLLSFWMCLEGTIVCKACQHHYLWFRIHLLSLWYRPVPRVGNKDAETEFFLSQRSPHLLRESGGPAAVGATVGTPGPPGVSGQMLWGRGQPEVR